MNTGFYKDLDTNFEQALEMADYNFTHDELIELLKIGNIPQKQIAALKLDTVCSKYEAETLLSNLTGCDGKIREAVALKINNLVSSSKKISSYFTQAEIFADASIDINANICRLVIDSVAYLIENNEFIEKYKNKILSFITESFSELDKFVFRDKKYVINKQLFKLYWSLEALKLVIYEIDENSLYDILERASKEKEYTVREKVAQILNKLDSKIYYPLKEKLKNDENYYVRNALNH